MVATVSQQGSPLAGGEVVGQVQLLPVNSVQPNGWNPNQMSPTTYQSLRFGLEKEGWLASQALLVWASDDKGVQRMLIIDGEHRWRVAGELGFPYAPMVLLQGLSEARAKALTVAMNNRKGAFDDALLGDLLRGIQFDVEDLDKSVGMSPDALMAFLAEVKPVDLDNLPGAPSALGEDDEPGSAPPAGVAPSNVKMVQLFFDEGAHARFIRLITDLGKRYRTTTVTDTVNEAVKQAYAAAD